MRGSSKFYFFGETIMYVGRYIGMDVRVGLEGETKDYGAFFLYPMNVVSLSDEANGVI